MNSVELSGKQQMADRIDGTFTDKILTKEDAK